VTTSDPLAVLFDEDLCAELRISRRTLKRLRRAGAFPIPELPSLDKRHRYARRDVEAFLSRETESLFLARKRARA
jgi:predicted site-specific integrase-resolvase